MSFLLFITVIVLVIVLVSKKSNGPTSGADDRYAQGYWDGYRALGEKVQALLGHEPVDKDAVQREIDAGLGSGQPTVSEEPISSLPQTAEQTYIEPAPQTEVVTKEQQSIANLNTLLFVASLLFVAAGAAFVAAAMPDAVKLVGVWLLTAVFYAVGMLLRNTAKLKAAGTAFIGTSLGLIPFAGIALYQLANVPAPAAWCVTSLIGVVAYFYAAVRLQSQVVSYLTLAFVVSLASSFTESVSVPLMWNFVVIIGVSLVANVLAYLKPSWVPTLFKEPIERTGQLVTPLALVASLAVADQLPLYGYEVVFGVATLHYLVVWLQTRHRGYETAVRALAHVTLLLVAIDVFNNESLPIGITFLVLASLQQVYSLLRYDKAGVAYEWTWVSVMQVFQLISPLFWLTHDGNAELTVVAYTLLGISSAVLTLRSRRSEAALPGLLASLVIPFIVARWVIEPTLDWALIAGWFVLAASLIVAVWPTIGRRSQSVHYFFVGAFLSYLALGALVGLLCATGWSLVLFTVISALLWRGSYAIKQATLSVVGSVAFVFAIIQGWRFLELSDTWLPLGVAWFASTLLYLAYGLLLHYKDEGRAFGALGAVWVTLGLAALMSFFGSETDIAAALTVVVGAGTVAAEGYRRQDKRFLETAVYIATFGLQRTVGLVWPELNIVFYAHWWALTAAAMSVWRREFTNRLIVGMAFVTASTGLYALNEGGFYQLLFLAEHLALLIVGVLSTKRWAIWWGLIASVLAVLYFLRDIAFLAFAFLGLVVIGIVVWRLSRINQHKPD